MLLHSLPRLPCRWRINYINWFRFAQLLPQLCHSLMDFSLDMFNELLSLPNITVHCLLVLHSAFPWAQWSAGSLACYELWGVSFVYSSYPPGDQTLMDLPQEKKSALFPIQLPQPKCQAPSSILGRMIPNLSPVWSTLHVAFSSFTLKYKSSFSSAQTTPLPLYKLRSKYLGAARDSFVVPNDVFSLTSWSSHPCYNPVHWTIHWPLNPSCICISGPLGFLLLCQKHLWCFSSLLKSCEGLESQLKAHLLGRVSSVDSLNTEYSFPLNVCLLWIPASVFRFSQKPKIEWMLRKLPFLIIIDLDLVSHASHLKTLTTSLPVHPDFSLPFLFSKKKIASWNLGSLLSIMDLK